MPSENSRIARRFEALRAENRPGFVAYLMGGDPDPETSQQILDGLPAAGADIIELGMPFSDPMADGPAIQLAGRRALNAGMTAKKALAMVRAFRQKDPDTPIVLMGYYNPIYVYPVDAFLREAVAAGIDGLIVVDLPPEEDEELCLPALRAGLSFIRLATPTTDAARLPKVLSNTSGFVYYVSMTGITGAELKDTGAVAAAVMRIKAHTELPVCVGFGIKTAEDAALIGRDADGIAVGTSIVRQIEQALASGDSGAETTARVHRLVRELADGAKRARR